MFIFPSQVQGSYSERSFYLIALQHKVFSPKVTSWSEKAAEAPAIVIIFKLEGKTRKGSIIFRRHTFLLLTRTHNLFGSGLHVPS